ncbi:hypothetical protein L2E82_50873 [Cichorium intybus]|nr:hypothetical protein L2E82_50873 [Cichorium intybus]
MKSHIHAYGFNKRDDTLTYHGEIRTPITVHDIGPSQNQAPCHDITQSHDMTDVITDIMGENGTNQEEGNSDTKENDADDGFHKLLDEVQSELYPGCTWFSSVDFLAKLMHIKVTNKWRHILFHQLLELL